MLIICVNCVIPMDMDNMGVEVASASRETIHRGDRYTCGRCNHSVVADFGEGMTKYNIGEDNFKRKLSNADYFVRS